MICLIDGNNFFVSCERVFDVTLHNLPVIVLSSNDGCVISRSQEAKQLGIKMGQPVFELKSLLKEKQVKVFSSNFVLYRDMSERMMQVIADCVPRMEVYSIDEAFCYLDSIPPETLTQYGWEIKNKIKDCIGIPCGIGISYTKVLAKIANNLAKKSQKANGVLILIEDRHIDYALSATKVEDVWGIGRQFTKLLNANGIYTAKEFRDADPKWVQKNMSIVGVRLQKELRKEICFEIGFELPQKSITVSRSFSKRISHLEELISPLTYFVSSGAANLRKQKLETSTIGVYLQTSRFIEPHKRYSNSHFIKLPFSTSSDFHLLKAAIQCLEHIYRTGFFYKKCGIYLTDLKFETNFPSSLFDLRDIQKERNLFSAVDNIKDKFGHHAICLSDALDYSWKPLCSNRSREFTTNLNEILIV